MPIAIHMDSSPRSVLHNTVDQLLLEVSRESTLDEGNSTLSDNLLSALHSVFQQSLLHALDLVDKNHVTRFVCPSGRELFQVKASTGSKVYTCLVPSSYCNCPSFVYSVVLKEEALWCKHLLAVRLCQALERVESREVCGEDIAEMLTTDRDTLALGY